MDSILRNDAECNSGTALGELLEIVQQHLLVLEDKRIWSWELTNKLDAIIEKKDDPKYLFTGTARDTVHIEDILEEKPGSRSLEHQSNLSNLRPQLSRLDVPQSQKLTIPVQNRPMQNEVYSFSEPPLDENRWILVRDDDFARAVTGMRGLDYASEEPPSNLCQRCKELHFRDDLPLRDEVRRLEERSSGCSFCKLILQQWLQWGKIHGETTASTMYLYRQEFGLTFSKSHPSLPPLQIYDIPCKCRQARQCH